MAMPMKANGDNNDGADDDDDNSDDSKEDEIMNTNCKQNSKVRYSKLTGCVLVLFLPIIDALTIVMAMVWY